jgi:transposase
VDVKFQERAANGAEARVILLAASGMNGKQIALKMQTRAARVSKWLRRFARDRIAALNDKPRSGTKRPKYTSATEERILKALDHELVRRLLSIFLKDTSGRRPVNGQADVYAKNPT